MGKKSKLLILSEYVNKTQKIRGMWTNTSSYRENEVLSDVFTWNILRHNCFMFKYSMTESSPWIAPGQTRTSWCKHDVIKVCSIEYLTQIELVLPTFFQLLDGSQNYRILTFRLWNIYHTQQLAFLTHLYASCDKYASVTVARIHATSSIENSNTYIT